MGKRRRRLRLPTLLIKPRKPRRTKPKLRDKQPKRRSGKRTQPKRAGDCCSEQATQRKGSSRKGKPVKPQHFNLPKQPNTAKAPPVKFQQGRRIAGKPKLARSEIRSVSQLQITVARSELVAWSLPVTTSCSCSERRITGTPGYWFPAWGYNPNAYYAWDGPIYAHNRLPPDQVIANVQSALQQQGYYHGEVDGLIGPLTRGAIADYQRDHGLYTTSTIDQPTLQSLGIS